MQNLLLILFVFLSLVSCRTKKPDIITENQPALSTSSPHSVMKEKSQNKDARIDALKGEALYRRSSSEGELKQSMAADATRGANVGQMAAAKCMSFDYYAPPAQYQYQVASPAEPNTEQYDGITENEFHEAIKDPLSTFSIDVDVASYANARRFINTNQLPPKDAVRIEEFINYFPYSYKAPEGADPVSITADVANCLWNKEHRLVRVGLKGREVRTESLPPSNLVFLIDVSGSMMTPNKLPLLKSAFHLLVDQLRAKDKVSLVVYAGNAGLVLPATPGNQKEKIINAIDHLEAGGSTAGGAGIQLAYDIAKRNFLKDGNNRVILATDGDFNVGVSNDSELVRMIEEKRQDGIFLTVLGFGQGNYKDSKMEKLADKGNGNYAYVDNILEAKKVLVSEMGATLHTIAKDVKIQVEFNPAKVKGYRLIGYENRMLNAEDFNNDKKDAGEMGAGGTVTALYEIVPAGAEFHYGGVDPLKYVKNVITPPVNDSDELLTVKFRYKDPKGSTSKMVACTLTDRGMNLSDAPEDFRFATAVAGFGLLLRNSDYKDELTYDGVISLAKNALGDDPEGYRAEFLRLVKTCRTMVSANQAVR